MKAPDEVDVGTQTRRKAMRLTARRWQAADFPKITVEPSDENSDNRERHGDDAYYAWQYESPTSGLMLVEGTLSEATETAEASGLPWTDTPPARVLTTRRSHLRER